MRQQRFSAGILFSTVLWIGANLLLGILLLTDASSAEASASARVLQLVTPTPSPPRPSPDSYLQFYGTILGALATVVAAVIAGLFVVYQVRKNRRLEREKQEMERENQRMQAQLDAAREQRQHQNELERMQYDDRLRTQREERERKEAARAKAKAAMRHAQTPAERERAYHEALHADAEISQLQILDMSQPWR